MESVTSSEDKYNVTVEVAKEMLKTCKKDMKTPDVDDMDGVQRLAPSNDWTRIKSVPKVRFS
jgi:hypothetical protein